MTSRAATLRARSLELARAAARRLESPLGRPPATLPVESDAPTSATAPSSARRRDGAHPAGASARLLRPFRVRLARLDTRFGGDLRSAGSRLVTRERALPLTVAGLVLVASVLSVAPAAGQGNGKGTDPRTDGPRLVVGGGVLGGAGAADQVGTGSEDVAAADVPGADGAPADAALVDGAPADGAPVDGAGSDVAGSDTTTAGSSDESTGLHVLAAEYGQDSPIPVGPYLADGTLLKPVAVDPAVPDGRDQLVTYRVKSGDTLTGIAHKFGVSMMTLWWANKLNAKDELHIGQPLVIPPVDGLVVTVQAGDTIDAIAERTGTTPAEIIDFNDLIDSTLVVGQVLIVPGARGAGIATPAPKPTPKPAARAAVRSSRSSGRVAASSSGSYRGGRFSFPIPGHAISQYYHYGHLGIDIQGSTGDAVRAAAGGVVIYAGWRNNGGGYVVWISHGSGIYTTYNHLSAVLVGTGRSVSRGQVVGRVGATGWATGPHLHFEVWRGGVPGGVDRRVNPLAYL